MLLYIFEGCNHFEEHRLKSRSSMPRFVHVPRKDGDRQSSGCPRLTLAWYTTILSQLDTYLRELGLQEILLKYRKTNGQLKKSYSHGITLKSHHKLCSLIYTKSCCHLQGFVISVNQLQWTIPIQLRDVYCTENNYTILVFFSLIHFDMFCICFHVPYLSQWKYVFFRHAFKERKTYMKRSLVSKQRWPHFRWFCRVRNTCTLVPG